MPKTLDTVALLERRLGVSRDRAYTLAREGLVPIVRIGRQIRIDPDALEAWIRAGGTAAADAGSVA
jgi:putative molybdopterin biosynthesis protein